MTTVDRDNSPRDGRGRFRRSVESAERDSRAAELASRGWSYEAIASELGYADRAGAWRGVQRALIAVAKATGVSDLRAQQLAELQQLRMKMWETVDSPPPMTDRLGRVVLDPEGRPVPDEQVRQGAAQVLLRVMDRTAKLRGLDAPKRSTVSVAAVIAAASVADLREAQELLRIQNGLDGIDPNGAPGAVPGNVLPGKAEDV